MSISTSRFFPFSAKHTLVFGLFVFLYIVWTYFTMGFRIDHLQFVVFLSALFFVHKTGRDIIYYFVFFILFWLIYDSMRVFPNYLFNEVNILEPYLIEKSLFGISIDGKTYTLNEYLVVHQNKFLDFITGVFYLTWVPVPLGLAFYLFFKDKEMLLRFTAAYLFTNLLGFIIYYSYPAAPPWYYLEYGVKELYNIPSNAAQLVRFDELIGYPLFSNLYTKNSNVFAAIPSLHSAYPVVAFYYAFKKKLKIGAIIIFIDILGIWFSAVYSYHHYLLDVLLGAMCAVVGIFLFEKFIYQNKLSKILVRYSKFVES